MVPIIYINTGRQESCGDAQVVYVCQHLPGVQSLGHLSSHYTDWVTLDCTLESHGGRSANKLSAHWRD